jgi:hypothetical protein
MFDHHANSLIEFFKEVIRNHKNKEAAKQNTIEFLYDQLKEIHPKAKADNTYQPNKLSL